MYIVGIDENGLGPRLGPLVVTGSIFEIEADYHPARFWDEASIPGLTVNDSKKVFSQRNKARGERSVLVYYNHLFKKSPGKAEDFLSPILLNNSADLRRNCGENSETMCWEPGFRLPFWYQKGDITEVAEKINQYTVKLREVKAILCCPYNFNSSLSTERVGENKNRLDFSFFEDLIEYFYRKYGDEILYLCGKIGGTINYWGYFSFLNNFPGRQETGQSNLSSYRFDSLGTVQFIKDGDEIHFPIALSSMFGKYIREIFIERLNRFFCSRIPGLKPVSGYNDRLTREFIRQTSQKRKELGIPDDCFLRSK
jgi:ribonuclease HII